MVKRSKSGPKAANQPVVLKETDLDAAQGGKVIDKSSPILANVLCDKRDPDERLSS